ncbi:MAG: hypothetical protein WC619_02015 [Patescibacteria group bacterium]
MDPCPHCGEYPSKKYKYHLDDLDVATLLKIWQAVIEQKSNRIDVSNINLDQSERLRLTQLRFHGLVAKVKNAFGKQVPNTWLITERGADFLHGRVAVPAWVITFRNHVIDHSLDTKTKSDFRILKDFRATYDIINNTIGIRILQTKLF